MGKGTKDFGNENWKRTPEERSALARRAGRASGVARRRKANFKKVLNTLLTTEVDYPEWSGVLQNFGLETTLECIINLAMIRKALEGDVKAYEAIRNTLGQSLKTELDMEEQQARVDKMRAEIVKLEQSEVSGLEDIKALSELLR